MNDDFERRLGELLNQHVDKTAGPRSAAPPFDPQVHRRLRRPLVLPLIAAACVVLAVGGAFAVRALVSDSGSTPAANSSHPVSSPSTPSTTAASTASGTAQLAGASIFLPKGWVAVTSTPSPVDGRGETWCLQRPGTALANCPITLFTLVAPQRVAGEAIDVDRAGVVGPRLGEYCGGQAPIVSQRARTRAFGGRAADWRSWTFNCPDGASYQFEQYSVATVPGFVLFTNRASSVTVRDTVAQVVAHSTLPAPTGASRLMDRGLLRSAVRSGTTVTVSINRVLRVMNAHGVLHDVTSENPATYSVPAGLFDAVSPATGERVYLETDGNAVIAFAVDTG